MKALFWLGLNIASTPTDIGASTRDALKEGKKMKMSLKTGRWTVAIGGLVLSTMAGAQATWNWGNGSGSCDPTSCVSGTPPVTATVSGYGAETSSSAFILGFVNDVDPSGLGIKSKDGSGSDENLKNPNHSIDNFISWSGSSTGDSSAGGAKYAEVLAINFSQAVSLTQVAVAWTYSDSDAMIFRWDGGGAVDLASYKADQLPTTLNSTANGWTLVSAGQFASGSRYDNGAVVGSLSVNSTNLYSSYWLVSTALGQSSESANNDGFKVVSFTGLIKPPNGGGGGSVPEPGSMGLALAAFVGLVATRRRKSASR